MRASWKSPLKMVFVIGKGLGKQIEEIRKQAKESGLRPDEYLIIGDEKKNISELIGKFDKIKGGIDKNHPPLFVLFGHGINTNITGSEEEKPEIF